MKVCVCFSFILVLVGAIACSKGPAEKVKDGVTRKGGSATPAATPPVVEPKPANIIAKIPGSSATVSSPGDWDVRFDTGESGGSPECKDVSCLLLVGPGTHSKNSYIYFKRVKIKELEEPTVEKLAKYLEKTYSKLKFQKIEINKNPGFQYVESSEMDSAKVYIQQKIYIFFVAKGKVFKILAGLFKEDNGINVSADIFSSFQITDDGGSGSLDDGFVHPEAQHRSPVTHKQDPDESN
jgi:hypothetical protein